ncbi:MAG: Mrp/NBP35 family ATP-binding protein [Actinomycetota bacterium]|nr:Mrp/NBP35 family ATP-binding protein [Actinomycetota bacterium]
MVDQPALRAAIEQVEDPQLHRPLGQLGMLRELRVRRGGRVRAVISLPVPDHPGKDDLAHAVSAAARSVPGVGEVEVYYDVMPEQDRLRVAHQIRGDGREIDIGKPGSPTRVLAVGSGKGGVGKSSVTANLAVALVREGHSVGVIDADVWGFSIPKMLGVQGSPAVLGKMLLPVEAHGVRVVSMDFFVDADQAVIWRGPMLHKAVEQFLVDVFWDQPDFLLVDMPPGTGDVAISLSQFLPRAEAIIVTTPQPTAQRVARRAALMAEKVNQEVLGVVENMSWFRGDDGTRYNLFGEGGGALLAEELDVPLLAQIPLVPAMRSGADEGKPFTEAAPDSEAAEAFLKLAAEVLARRPRVRTHPELVIK